MYGHIYYDIPRATAAQLKAFSLIPTATLSDAMGRHGAMNIEIQPLYHDISMVGTALTVLCFPGDNIMTHKALQMVQPGDVMVIDDGDFNSGCFGHKSAMLMRQQGGTGAVMSGSIRDAKELRRDKFPIFCRGVSPRAPQKNTPGSINVAVHVGGLVVGPGDIVVGDDDGVVVVPLSQADVVLAKAQKRDLHERETSATSGELPLDPTGTTLDLDQMLAGKVIEHRTNRG